MIASADLTPEIEVIVGDIAIPHFGLTERDWEALSEHISAVFHCGAEVDYLKTYAELRAPNVFSSREVINLCCHGSAKTLHHISSTFILGWTTQQSVSEDDYNAEMRGLDFGYAQSKWVAEQLIVKARTRGLDARIYRPALVTASRHGRYVLGDIVVRVLSYMIRHGLSCDAPNQISFLPVDVCANNIVALSLLDVSSAHTYHLTADKYYTLQSACRCITERCGYLFEYVDLNTFVHHVKRHCGPEDALFPLVAFLRTNKTKIERMREKRYNNTNYQAARRRSEHSVPEPALGDTMEWIIEFLRREGLVDPVRKSANSSAGTYSQEA